MARAVNVKILRLLCPSLELSVAHRDFVGVKEVFGVYVVLAIRLQLLKGRVVPLGWRRMLVGP